MRKRFILAFVAGAIAFGLTACGTQTHTYDAEPVDGSETCFFIEREVGVEEEEIALGVYCLNGERDEDYEEPESEFYDD